MKGGVGRQRGTKVREAGERVTRDSDYTTGSKEVCKLLHFHTLFAGIIVERKLQSMALASNTQTRRVKRAYIAGIHTLWECLS